MSDRPTDEAHRFFRQAQHWFNNSKGAGFKDNQHIGNVIAGLSEMATGLEMLASGLRATYVLLEKVDQKLDRQRMTR